MNVPILFTAMPALTLEQAVAEAVAAGATCLDGNTFDNARADQISVELCSWIRANAWAAFDLQEFTKGDPGEVVEPCHFCDQDGEVVIDGIHYCHAHAQAFDASVERDD